MLGDAAAILVLETAEHARRRGARVYARLAGWAGANDPFHPTAPDSRGDGAAHAMAAALKSAGLRPMDVDYVNAHGTGSPANDGAELAAIARVLGDSPRTYVSSTKAATGHTLGAAGALEAVIAVLSIDSGCVPGTATLDTPISAPANLVLSREPTDERVDVAMSNSMAFGGNVMSLVFERP
jgi:3-oxoacyl-[acyl-carrier-protein] synthase II